MTSAEVEEAQRLIKTRADLGRILAKNEGAGIEIESGEDHVRLHVYLPDPLGRQLLLCSLALVNDRLERLGVSANGDTA